MQLLIMQLLLPDVGECFSRHVQKLAERFDKILGLIVGLKPMRKREKQKKHCVLAIQKAQLMQINNTLTFL